MAFVLRQPARLEVGVIHLSKQKEETFAVTRRLGHSKRNGSDRHRMMNAWDCSNLPT